MTWQDLSPTEVHQLLTTRKDVVVLDVRTPPEHASHRLQDCQLVPLQVLAEHVSELDPSRLHVVYCEHGMRSQVACDLLAHQGFRALINLRGGIANWLGHDLPCVTAASQPETSAPAKPGWLRRKFKGC